MATIAGQHITQFDGRVIEFLGSCRNVLARDVISDTFTLVRNYDANTLTLVTDGRQVEVTFTGTVKVDGSATDAPFAFANTEVVRTRDSIVVRNRGRFSLECDVTREACVFRMSGWYHGRVAGLMGTYTNEQIDDFVLPNGALASDVTELAASWETSGEN